ncbi:MAG: dUTP diphosphatase [Gemmatimonadetes bacterium]|nr:dUTP diphosphatase [Gemmatimonadota bacterium]
MSDQAPAILFEPLHEGVKAPTRATEQSAGYDLRAYLRGRTVRFCRGAKGETYERQVAEDEAGIVLQPGERALIPMGFRARLPDGYEAQIRIRSSAAFRKGLVLPNAPGTIDADYPDEWLVMIRNDSGEEVMLEHGERVAQVVLKRYEVLAWEEGRVGRNTGRVGGVGSTG